MTSYRDCEGHGWKVELLCNGLCRAGRKLHHKDLHHDLKISALNPERTIIEGEGRLWVCLSHRFKCPRNIMLTTAPYRLLIANSSHNGVR